MPRMVLDGLRSQAVANQRHAAVANRCRRIIRADDGTVQSVQRPPAGEHRLNRYFCQNDSTAFIRRRWSVVT